MKGHATRKKLSEVQLLRLRVTFHTLSLFYLRAYGRKNMRQWKSAFIRVPYRHTRTEKGKFKY